MPYITPTPAPLLRTTTHSTSVTADTDILADAIGISAGRTVALLRIEVAFSAGSLLSARIARAGITVEVSLNSGNALSAPALYIFDIILHSGDTLNLRYGASATLLVCRIHEVGSQAA